ncbi:MAG: hypothetical protein AAF702_00170 [Chloroflexota bacterium]
MRLLFGPLLAYPILGEEDSGRTLFGLFLFAGSLLFFEIGLTRLFATIYYPPTVFAILSLGVLGIGLGAGFAAWRPQWRSQWRTAETLSFYASGAAIFGLVLVVTILYGHALPIPKRLDFWMHLALVLPPFICAGLFFATYFSQDAANAAQLYFADLLGAGLSALLVVPIFQSIGAVNGLLLAMSGLAAAALFVQHTNRVLPDLTLSSFRSVPTATFLLIIMLLITHGFRLWPESNWAVSFRNKPLGQQLASGATLLASRWDAFARTDLIDPGDGRPYELYMDGAAGSVMPPADGDPALWQDIGFFPFATEQPKHVFLIGPGGGLDIWFGIQGRAEAIVAAEVNPGSVELVRAFASYNGDLYGDIGTGLVTLLTEDGRSVLERELHRYDLIFLSQVVTLAAERAGFALTENHVYTVEAMKTYLNRLTDGGQVAFKLYDEVTLTRALVTAVTALTETGSTEQDALNHIMVLIDPNAEPAIPLLMVRKSPYSRDDVLSIAAVAERVGFRPLYLPGEWAEPPLSEIVNGTKSLADVVNEAENAIGPTRDDRPFFFQFERGIASTLRWLIWLAGGLTLVALILPPLLAPAERKVHLLQNGIYFSGLGLGFMLVEIALIQQTQLVLGHPTLSISVVLASLLIGGGLGSALWGKRVSMPSIPLFGIVLGIGLWWFIWPLVRQSLLAADWWLRLAMVVLCILPLALMMGIPFPAGLRRLAADPTAVALAWGINGIMSVVAAIAGLAIAQLWGFSYLLVVAGAAYVAVWGICALGMKS